MINSPDTEDSSYSQRWSPIIDGYPRKYFPQPRNLVGDIVNIANSSQDSLTSAAHRNLIQVLVGLDEPTKKRIIQLYEYLPWFDPFSAVTRGIEMTDEELNIMVSSNEMCHRASDSPY